MKTKTFFVAALAFIVSAGLSYAIGYLFNIQILKFHYEFTSESGGTFLTIGSLFPLAIGVIASYIAKKRYMNKSQQNLG
ncbi:hypothetical protein D1B31_15135 [Neobacillus notoginsengisoli]|uniref:Uncharacterized protein n=1 Tax=Neobacillus notoginsengisoli TaxID=1578198 RepID=A0A417YS34_9BACI|nr:hypothetical protein [Neobacillus notoginsengisoli]RHW38108.1 hypothetical protein D1B31_15135 [Neobacillus notoginsengisoli]